MGTETKIFAYVSQQMNLALNRLEAEFAREPALYRRIVTALLVPEAHVVQIVPTRLEA